MKMQTAFGSIAAETNDRLFGPALILVRIAAGGLLFSFGRLVWLLAHSVTVPQNLPSLETAKALAIHGGIANPLALCFMAIGVCYVLGFLTRPAGVLLILVLVAIDVSLLPIATVKLVLWNHALMFGIALLGISGGMGHAFGLNGLLARNTVRSGGFVRSLFS